MTIRYIASRQVCPKPFWRTGPDANCPAPPDLTVRPLDQLGPELHIQGGPEALFHLLESAVSDYKASHP